MIGACAHFSVLVVLTQFFYVYPVTASTCGFVIAALINYILNYQWTFKSENSHKDAMPKFFFIAIAGLFFNAVIMEVLIKSFKLHYLVSQIAATGVVLLWNFTGNKIWTFKAVKEF
ncbi:MAG: GtrA family protein [Syntrophaceae bacterium]|nr:GtrA family protein [Syntrophaceae bacterium]